MSDKIYSPDAEKIPPRPSQNYAPSENGSSSSRVEGGRHIACDGCYRQKLRCDGVKPACQRCSHLRRDCTFNRTSVPKAGRKKKESKSTKNLEARVKELELALAKSTSSEKIIQESHNLEINNIFSSLSQNKSDDFCIPSVKQMFVPMSLSMPPHSQTHLIQSPHANSSNHDLPLSPEMILDILQSFFSYSNWWPINFIHPQSFIAKRNFVNPSLMYAICARGCQFSKCEQTMKSMGVNLSEMLFETAKRLFDVEEMTFENLMAVIHMGMFCISNGKLRQFWAYFNLVSNLVHYLQLYIDPDDLERRHGYRWSVIEKETRRRVWSIVGSVFLRSTLGSKLSPFEITVRRPLPLRIFHSLSDNTAYLNLYSSPMSFVNDVESYDAEPLAQDLSSFAAKIREFHTRNVNFEPTIETHMEADILYQYLNKWLSSSPTWFQTALWSNHFNLAASVPVGSGIPMLAVHSILIYHSLVIFLYRFSYSSLCNYPPTIYPPDMETPQSINKGLKICWNSHQLLMNAFKSSRVFTENHAVFRTYPLNAGILTQPTLFSCTMAKFADSKEMRDAAIRDFHYLKHRLSNIDPTYQKFSDVMILDDLRRIDELPYGLERHLETNRLFMFGLEDLENKIISELYKGEKSKLRSNLNFSAFG
ncbi:hypothetical protein HK096_003617, partial [Nowakowskiella sp. JEL0078]